MAYKNEYAANTGEQVDMNVQVDEVRRLLNGSFLLVLRDDANRRLVSFADRTDLKVGQRVNVRGPVRKLEMFRGLKSTVLERPIFSGVDGPKPPTKPEDFDELELPEGAKMLYRCVSLKLMATLSGRSITFIGPKGIRSIDSKDLVDMLYKYNMDFPKVYAELMAKPEPKAEGPAVEWDDNLPPKAITLVRKADESRVKVDVRKLMNVPDPATEEPDVAHEGNPRIF